MLQIECDLEAECKVGEGRTVCSRKIVTSITKRRLDTIFRARLIFFTTTILMEQKFEIYRLKALFRKNIFCAMWFYLLSS